MEVEKVAKRPDVNPETGEKKYGNVEYADEKNKKYPIDTARHVRAALSYINMAKNAAKYNSSDLSTMKSKIYSAAKKFGIEVSTAKSVSLEDFTANIMKTYEENGEIYLVGEGSGIEKDLDGEHMDLEALKGMAQDIADGYVDEDGEWKPVMIKNTHTPDGITTEIGEVVESGINKDNHLFIKAKLYKDNPDAVYLHKATKSREEGGYGKKFGLSVEGKAWKLASEYDPTTKSKSNVIQDVFTRAFAVTTRPSWSQSWLSTVEKSFKKIEEEEEKERVQSILIEKSMDEDEKKDEGLETSQPEVTPENPKSDASSESKTEETKSEDIEEKSTEKSEATSDKGEEVKKADGGVSIDHIAHVSGRLEHASNMLRGIARGVTAPDETLDYVSQHLGTTHKMLKGLKSGDTTLIENSMASKLPNPSEIWMSEKEEELKDDVKKSQVEETDEITKSLIEKSVEETVEKAMLKVDSRLDNVEKSVEKLESLPLVPKGFARPVIKGNKETSADSEYEKVKEVYKAFERDLTLPDDVLSPVRFGMKWNEWMPKFKEYGLLKK